MNERIENEHRETALTISNDSTLQTLPPAPLGWERAKFPLLYKRAREALIECLKIDECLEWKRKAEAFASYYRQAQDKTPYNIALRIRLRAWRRCGELFLEMFGSDGPDQAGIGVKTRKGKLADALGISASDGYTARRLAKIPEAEFEEMIEREPPATISELLPHAPYPQFGGSPEQRAAASVTHALGRILTVIDNFDPEIIGQLLPQDRGEPLFIPQMCIWLEKFAKATKTVKARGFAEPGDLPSRARK